MRVYVLGAGASYPVYPLASALLREIDGFVRSMPECTDRFDYSEWPKILAWIENHPDPLLREAYRNGNLEEIFTLLDFAKNLHDESLISIMQAGKQGKQQVSAAEANYKSLDTNISEYERVRQILLWATEHYFEFRHNEDCGNSDSDQWNTLRRFEQKVNEGDVVITFNYDSTVERVLWQAGKWSPANGYGAELVFQKSRNDETRVEFPRASVVVLHLHGAIGWFRKPAMRADYPLDEDGGAVPREALSPAPLETEVSLDPLFLQGLGISAVDASLPDRPSDEYQILLHPSFLKDYSGEDIGNEIFLQLWKQAADALRKADEIVVIGYSLPAADSAAWTLLLTTCNPQRTAVVNPDNAVMWRYRRLLKLPTLHDATDFAAWLNKGEQSRKKK